MYGCFNQMLTTADLWKVGAEIGAGALPPVLSRRESGHNGEQRAQRYGLMGRTVRAERALGRNEGASVRPLFAKTAFPHCPAVVMQISGNPLECAKSNLSQITSHFAIIAGGIDARYSQRRAKSYRKC